MYGITCLLGCPSPGARRLRVRVDDIELVRVGVPGQARVVRGLLRVAHWPPVRERLHDGVGVDQLPADPAVAPAGDVASLADRGIGSVRVVSPVPAHPDGVDPARLPRQRQPARELVRGHRHAPDQKSCARCGPTTRPGTRA